MRAREKPDAERQKDREGRAKTKEGVQKVECLQASGERGASEVQATEWSWRAIFSSHGYTVCK